MRHARLHRFIIFSPLALQAQKLVHPTNPKAVGAAATGRGCAGVGGDTEAGVKKWRAKLFDKLKGVNPAPVDAAAESPDAPPTRIELVIADYVPAAVPGSAG